MLVIAKFKVQCQRKGAGVTAAQLRRRQTKTNESASLENMITNYRTRIYARRYKDGGEEAAGVSNCVS